MRAFALFLGLLSLTVAASAQVIHEPPRVHPAGSTEVLPVDLDGDGNEATVIATGTTERRRIPCADGLTPLVSAWSGSIAAVQFVETFDGGSNTGGWSFHGPNEQIRPAGGNPGAHLHTTDLDTYAPRPGTTLSSIFSGNYRATGVTRIGVDLLTVDVDFSAEGRPLTLMLTSKNGTPFDPNDDWAAYLMGPNIPLPGEGWKSYDFEVPSSANSLPPGWRTIPFGPNSPPTPDWNALMIAVASAGFFYGDPEMLFIFQMWELGLDNPRITYVDPAGAEEPEVAGDPRGTMSISPNPSVGAVTIRLPLADPTGGRIDIHSVDGRRVVSWAIGPDGGGSASFAWDGRDADGGAVPAGVYFVRARSGGSLYGARLIRLEE